MKAPQAPHLDERRADEFTAELRERAQAWIPEWGLADGERDFGRALLQIAARFSSEVAERLDRAGEKMRRGFLDWLGIPRKAARPARLPVVFKLVDAAQEAVLASGADADAGGCRRYAGCVRNRKRRARGAGPAGDRGRRRRGCRRVLSPAARAERPPAAQAAADAVARQKLRGCRRHQGAARSRIGFGFRDDHCAADGQQYKIVKVDKDLVTIEPPLVTELTGSNPGVKGHHFLAV